MMLKLLISLLLLSQPTLAFIENRSVYPIGDSENQMANTGIALAGSPSASYYNPAGLARIRVRKVSATGNSFMLLRSSASPIAQFDGKDLDLTVTTNQIVPSSVISTWQSSGWSYSFAIFVPELFKSTLNESYSTTNYDVLLNRTLDSQFAMAGLSAGTSISNSLDIGAGCSVAQFQTTSAVSLNGLPKVASGLTTMVLSQNYTSSQIFGLLCQTGLQYIASPGHRFGTVIRLPFQQLSGRGKYSVITQDSAGTKSSTGIRNVDTKYAVPMEFGFGYANFAMGNWMVLVDLSYQMEGEYQAVDGVSNPTKVKGTLRYNFGSEYTIDRIWKWRAGFAINPGAGVMQNSGDTVENFQVLSLGFQRSEGPTTLGVGLVYGQSTGEIMLSSTRMGKVGSSALSLTLNSGIVF